MYVACACLLTRDPVLVNNVGLVYVEDLDVVGECFSPNLKISIAKWAVARNLK